MNGKHSFRKKKNEKWDGENLVSNKIALSSRRVSLLVHKVILIHYANDALCVSLPLFGKNFFVLE